MTVLVIAGLILLFIIVPYLTGNVYGFVFRKKEMGIVSTYLAGMTILYAMLMLIQFFVIKFKFNLAETAKVYNVLFVVCVVLGAIAFGMRLLKEQSVYLDVSISKRSIWI